MRKIILIAFVISLVQQLSLAQSNTKKYTIFNPTPRNQMRDMETDRPDITESAYSVDAGHFQLETDLFKQVRNRQETGKSIQNYFNLINLKIGLTHSADFQVVVENYVVDKFTDNLGTSIKKSGFGSISLRYKQNLWGNDAGKTALAAMPYIKLPTGRFVEHQSIEGGIIFPFAMDLNNGWGMGAQGQFELQKSESGYQTLWLNSITFAKDLSEKWNGFVEGYYTYLHDEKAFDAHFNGGISYQANKDLKFDLGFNYGLTKNSDKVYFAGISFRY